MKYNDDDDDDEAGNNNSPPSKSSSIDNIDDSSQEGSVPLGGDLMNEWMTMDDNGTNRMIMNQRKRKKERNLSYYINY